MPRAGMLSVAVLGLVVALGAGAAAGVALASPDAPEVLGEAPAITSVPVATREYDDARTVSVDVTTGAADQVLSPAAGRVTTSGCVEGSEVTSGQALLSVNGVPLVVLATAVAPWRDLTVRDRGTDARALNDELHRLGYPAPEGERVTAATVAAFRQLVAAAGGAAPPAGTIPQSMIAWLPSAPLTIGVCNATAGSWVDAGQEIASSVVPVVSAQVADAPANVAPGARILEIGDVTTTTDADGAVIDPSSLAAVASSTAFEQADVTTGVAQLNGTWRLAEPVTVWVVPPGAIVGLRGAEGCVSSGGVTHPVRVVGSELGQSFVVPSDTTLDIATVDIAPADSTPCP